MMKPEDRKALGLTLLQEEVAKTESGKEKELQRICESELMRRGIAYLHLSPRAREKQGWPDLTFVVDGRPCAVELKTATGKLRPEQEKVLEQMKANGWETHVCRSYSKFRQVILNER